MTVNYSFKCPKYKNCWVTLSDCDVCLKPHVDCDHWDENEYIRSMRIRKTVNKLLEPIFPEETNP